MAEHDLIEEHLERVRRELRGPEADDVVAELRDHLLESAANLEGEGVLDR